MSKWKGPFYFAVNPLQSPVFKLNRLPETFEAPAREAVVSPQADQQAMSLELYSFAQLNDNIIINKHEQKTK